MSAVTYTLETRVLTGVCVWGGLMRNHFNQRFNVRQRETCVSVVALYLYTSGLFLQHLLTAVKHGI